MITPRDYQADGIAKGIEFFESSQSQVPSVYVAPVAAGKSIIIGGIAAELTHPTLVMQPSKELLEQNYKKLVTFGGNASIFSASVGKKEIGHTTYATLGSIKKNAKDFKKIGVKNVIIDECHLGYSPKEDSMFRKFMDELNPENVLGFTATPIRLKKYGDMTSSWSQLNMITRTNPKYFKEILDVVPISMMVERGFWSELLYEQYDFDESTLILNTTKAEFTEHSIKRAISEQGINNNIYLRIKSLLRDGRKNILVFTDSVETAKKMCEQFPTISAYVDGNTPKASRTKIIESFKNGNLKIVFNFGTLTTGFDHEELDTVILGRPTNSLSLFYQMTGRGTRIHINKKDCLIIDFCNNVKRFGRLETLNFRNIEGYGWGMFSDDNLLTGIPMGTKVSLEEIQNKANLKKENLIDFTLDFGKFKGRKLSTVPLDYRNWMLANVDGLATKSIKKDLLKEQLLALLEEEATVPLDMTKLIIIDLNNIAYKLHKSRKLNQEGMQGYMTRLSQTFNTSNIVIVNDADKYTYWRKKVYPDYKENRKPQELDDSFFKGLNQIIKELNVITKEGLEADDLIAASVRSTKYENVYVISSDGDFKQLGVFNRFHQINPSTDKEVKVSKKEAIGVLLTKVLKGDSKDNIKKSHNHKRILTKDLDKVVNEVFQDILTYVKDNNIVKIEEVGLKEIFWKNLSKKYDMNKDKFNLNFKLLNLIQKEYDLA